MLCIRFGEVNFIHLGHERKKYIRFECTNLMFFVHATKSASIAEPQNLLLKMTDDQQFCLRWNDFQTNMVASFKHLRDEKSFCDVTIATEVASFFPLA